MLWISMDHTDGISFKHCNIDYQRYVYAADFDLTVILEVSVIKPARSPVI